MPEVSLTKSPDVFDDVHLLPVLPNEARAIEATSRPSNLFLVMEAGWN